MLTIAETHTYRYQWPPLLQTGYNFHIKLVQMWTGEDIHVPGGKEKKLLTKWGLLGRIRHTVKKVNK